MKTRWGILLLSFCACQTSPPPPSQSGQTMEVLSDLPALIQEQLDAWHAPGIAVGIVKDGEVVFMQAFGYRDREAQLPVTTRTLFPIASCSKAFTALSAAIAESEGILDWQTPLVEYIPRFEMMDPQATKEADLDDFLRHRSGFGEERFLPLLSGADRAEVIRRLKYVEPEGEFGKGLIYSNLGYTIAGYAVGVAAGKTWEAFTAERIFEPLDMASSGFSVEEMEETGDYAVGYLNLLDFAEPQRYGVSTLTALAPAGGIISNLEDMVRWLRFNLGDGSLEGRRLVSPERLQALHEPHTDLSSNPKAELVTYRGYGYGWWSETYRGYNHVHHGGLGNGYISQVSFIPEENIGVVVLTNLYYAHLHQALIYHVFDRLLGLPETNHFDRELSGLTAYMAGWVDDYRAFWDGTDQNPPPSRELQEFTGQYANPAWGRASVELQDGTLGLTFQSGYRMGLRHYDKDVFATEDEGVQLAHKLVTFETGSEGGVAAFTLALGNNVEPIRFVR